MSAPLYDADGTLKFFIGGQINCSTTIRSNTDVLKILSMSDDPEDDKEAAQSVRSVKQKKKSFFGFARKERYVSISRSDFSTPYFRLKRRACFGCSVKVFSSAVFFSFLV